MSLRRPHRKSEEGSESRNPVGIFQHARVLAFDMGRSMRATILGLGGEHYDLGADGAIAFQPLARIDRDGYRTWAAEWIEGRLTPENSSSICAPPRKKARWPVVPNAAAAPPTA